MTCGVPAGMCGHLGTTPAPADMFGFLLGLLGTQGLVSAFGRGLAMCKASTGVHAALGAPQGLKAPILALGAQTLHIREWGTSLRSGSVCVPLPT